MKMHRTKPKDRKEISMKPKKRIALAEETIAFLERLKDAQHFGDMVDCLILVDLYQRTYGYFNVDWKPETQVMFMYFRLKKKYGYI